MGPPMAPGKHYLPTREPGPLFLFTRSLIEPRTNLTLSHHRRR